MPAQVTFILYQVGQLRTRIFRDANTKLGYRLHGDRSGVFRPHEAS